MKRKNQRKPGDWQEVCREMRPGDGMTPEMLKRVKLRANQRSARGMRGVSARQWQLCKAASRSVEMCLSADCGDASLKELRFCAVEPLEGGSALIVIMAAPIREASEIPVLEAKLARAGGLLRSALAADLHRKRVPHLRFRVIPEMTE
jgi:hypothetical protein